MTTLRIGLTGSIGMGKSTTAALFADEGVPVWDADAAVHRIYAAGGPGAAALSRVCPEAITADGAVDRAILRRLVGASPGLLSRIETAVHPLVAADRLRFLEAAEARGEPLVVLDIPLLYETHAEDGLDKVVVVSAPPNVQRDRVLARPGMTPEQFALILSRQIPDPEKRRRADFVIETTTLDSARAAVKGIIARLRGPHA